MLNERIFRGFQAIDRYIEHTVAHPYSPSRDVSFSLYNSVLSLKLDDNKEIGFFSNNTNLLRTTCEKVVRKQCFAKQLNWLS